MPGRAAEVRAVGGVAVVEPVEVGVDHVALGALLDALQEALAVGAADLLVAEAHSVHVQRLVLLAVVLDAELGDVAGAVDPRLVQVADDVVREGDAGAAVDLVLVGHREGQAGVAVGVDEDGDAVGHELLVAVVDVPDLGRAGLRVGRALVRAIGRVAELDGRGAGVDAESRLCGRETSTERRFKVSKGCRDR